MRAPLIALLAMACAPLAGCGFTPLYATPALTPALSSVDVVVPGTSRTGFLIKEQLARELNRDPDEPAHYRLSLILNETRAPEGVRVNNVANRYEIDLTASYILADATTGKVLRTGAVSSEVSYDSADPPYSGVVANQNGEERIAQEAAIRIRLELSRYFQHQATP
ncbi:MAG: LPS assembly lipoprotein LptE [Caulobacteraceae bacterium]